MNKTLLLFILTMLVSLPMASTDIYIPIIPFLTKDLSTSINLVNLTISSYVVGIAISMLLFGFISDQLGRKQSLIISLTIYIISSLFIGYSNNIYLFIVLRFFQGIGGGAGTVVGRLILKDYFKRKEQLSLMSSLSMWQSLAPAIAPQIGTYIFRQFNWESIFYLLVY